ncbi:hypothetical protein Tco_0640751, partial [Tanacetum coccineum]
VLILLSLEYFTMRMTNMILQRRIGTNRKEMKAELAFALDEPTPVVAEPEADSLAIEKLKEKNSDRVRIPPMKRKKIKQVSWISGDVQNNQIDQNASHLASTPRFHRAVIRRPSECVDIVTTDCRAKFVVGFCVQYFSPMANF